MKPELSPPTDAFGILRHACSAAARNLGLTAAPHNTFNISCDEGATADGEKKRTSIFIEIIGKEPQPNSQVQVFLDGDPVRLSTDAKGTISTDCHSCSDNFAYLWNS